MSRASGNILLTPTPGVTPPNAFGDAGDFCFDSTSQKLYGPKAASGATIWPLATPGGGGGGGLTYVDLSTSAVSVNIPALVSTGGGKNVFDFSAFAASFTGADPVALNMEFQMNIVSAGAENFATVEMLIADIAFGNKSRFASEEIFTTTGAATRQFTRCCPFMAPVAADFAPSAATYKIAAFCLNADGVLGDFKGLLMSILGYWH